MKNNTYSQSTHLHHICEDLMCTYMPYKDEIIPNITNPVAKEGTDIR
jgi:hypothetical protein